MPLNTTLRSESLISGSDFRAVLLALQRSQHSNHGCKIMICLKSWLMEFTL